MKKNINPPAKAAAESDALVAAVEHELDLVYQHLEALEMTIDSYKMNAADSSGGKLPGAAGNETPTAAGGQERPKKARLRAAKVVIRRPALIVDTYEFFRRGDGFADVRLNTVPCELPPVLADLLEFLATGPVGADGLVEARSFAAIAARLADRHQREFSVPTIRQAISRLRGVLKGSRLIGDPIKSSAQGVQFLWRRAQEKVIVSEPKHPRQDT